MAAIMGRNSQSIAGRNDGMMSDAKIAGIETRIGPERTHCFRVMSSN